MKLFCHAVARIALAITHLQPDGLLTDVDSQVQLSELVKTSLTDAEPSKLILKRQQPRIYHTALQVQPRMRNHEV